MIYLILAILSSASLALGLRISEVFSENRYGILLGNYATCAVLAFLLMPEKQLFPPGMIIPLLAGVVNGILYFTTLVLMQRCIQENGAALTAAFARLGLVLPVTASMLFFREFPSLLQALGLILVVAAIWVLNSGDKRRRGRVSGGLLLALLLSGGMADGMSKVFEQIGERRYDGLFLFYTFLVALLLTLVLALRENRRSRMGKVEVISGILLGIPNYFSTSLLLAAVTRLPAYVVYPRFSVGTILVVSLVSVVILQDPMTRRQAAGCGMILAALALLNL